MSLLYEGSPALSVEGNVHYYTAECTYLDLVLIIAPLLWVFGASLWRNTRRIAIAALVILGGNLIRTWASVYFHVRGMDRFYAHDLPDYIIWWPTVVVLALLALRRDLRDHFRAKPDAVESEAAAAVNGSEVLCADNFRPAPGGADDTP